MATWLFSLLLLLLPFGLAFSQDSIHVVPKLHSYGAELDLGWEPGALWEGRHSTLWLGVEGNYKNWNYYHDPLTGDALSSADSSSASVSEVLGLWFAGYTQGLVPQGQTQALSGRQWEDPDMLEAFAYYRGVYYHTLSSGSYLGTSSAPDKNGFLETSFMGGLSLDRLSVPDAHNLKDGYLFEVSATAAPRALQSVAVDYNRVTFISQGFLPLWDASPDSKLNTFSLLGGLNLAADHMWGDTIPAEERQLIGGRAWDGVGGWEEGSGGAIRGIESGRFDGTDKAVANVELRLNLPGFEIPDPFAIPFLDPVFRCVPGIMAYTDAGYWQGGPGISQGSGLSAGLGAYFTVMKYGSIAFYGDYWIAGGQAYNSKPIQYTLELGMHF